MEFVTQIDIDTPAEIAWLVLGERFGEIATWSGSLDASHLVGDLGPGAQRVCRSSQSFGPFPPSEVTEQLREFDRSSRTLRYEATEGIPRMFEHASNRWTVEPVGPSRCRVTSTATLKLAWWAKPLGMLMRVMMRGPMRTFTAELREAVEREAARSDEVRAT